MTEARLKNLQEGPIDEPFTPLKRRILILSSSTGGGHDMRARALTGWLRQEHGDTVVCRQWQALEGSSLVDRLGVCLYNTIQRRMPAAHHLYFNFLEAASLHRGRLLPGPKKRFFAELSEVRPEVIVSVHAHLNHAYFKAAKEFSAGKIRCLTYCGELSGGYGFSRHWVNPDADGFIAAVEECAGAARRLGMPPEKTQVGGFLLEPAFFETGEDAKGFRAVDGSEPVLLLGTGANGANRHLAVLRALAATSLRLRVIALCGRNGETLAAIEREQPVWPSLSVQALGYREDMAELLRAADLAFIRPGTGTTSECIVTGCPVLFNGIGGVMPQERITVRFMRGRGVDTEVAFSAKACAAAVQRFFSGDWRGRVAGTRRKLVEINQTLHPRQIVDGILR